MSAAKSSGVKPGSSCWASRLVRLETGSSSEAVLASQIVVSAKGSGETPLCRASRMTTGVSSTAVVSRERNTVLATASTTTSSQSSHVRPPPSRAARAAITRNSPASAASSVTTVMPTTKSSTGQTRSPSASASSTGRTPSRMRAPPSASSPAPITPVFTPSIPPHAQLRTVPLNHAQVHLQHDSTGSDLRWMGHTAADAPRSLED